MGVFIKCFLAIFLINLAFILEVNATIINANSCSQSSVQSAISGANSGDTITVPAGNCTWSSILTISKAITLEGAGIDQTTINTTYSGYAGAIQVTANASLNTRITGFTFGGSGIIIGVSGAYNNSSYVRLDHLKWTYSGSSDAAVFLAWNDNQPGLVDHCIFINSSLNRTPEFIHVFGGSDNANSWARASNLGSSAILYVEDCTFDASSGGGLTAIDSWDGARYVFRHNTVTKGIAGTHGNWGGWPHGPRQHEIYNNTFVPMGYYGIIDYKGGTGVIYNNTSNASNRIGMYTQEAYRGDGPCCCASTIGNPNCTQRPGYGQAFTREPMYIWANTNMSIDILDSGESGCDSVCGGHQDPNIFIQANREYSISPKMGYNPLTYPHPLTGAGNEIQPPQNLRFIQ